MDVDHATLSPAHAGGNTDPVTKIDGVFSMGEFMSGFEAEHAAVKAARSAAAALKAPGISIGPVAVGARSSKNTISLHEKCQALGIPQPLFEFGGSSDRGWNGKVSFSDLEDAVDLQGIKDEQLYSSKQEAKERLSERALAIMERLEKDGRVKRVKATRAHIRASRYTVALHDKSQKLGIPQPFFTYSGSTDLGWSAEVSFPGLDVVQVLTDEGCHASKQKAKEALSKRALDAVESAEREGKFEKFDKAKGPARLQPKEKEDPGPNYVGQLLGTYWTPHWVLLENG